ncbi:MAG: binding-protein-dependent transport system inner rane component [Chloroflexi bacterium]|nr:binding-protein-dependent transport system inner rane component [Chloroflexota bacterium]
MQEQILANATAGESTALSQPRPRSARFLRRLIRRPLALIGAVIVLLFLLTAVFGPMLAPHNPDYLDYSAVLAHPSASYPFGTDDTGRDILSRIIAGARISLTVGLVAVGTAMIIGTLVGLFAGYLGGWVDQVIMRLADVLLAFPDILLAIVIIAILGPGLVNVMIAVGVSAIPVYVRTVRAAVLSVREQEFVEAARALGASSWRIMWSHILRNVTAPIIVLATLGVGLSILTAAGLSFLGLGAQPPTPEWGDMLNEAQTYLQQAWWMAVFPGAAIMLVVIGLNLLGDGLRDLLDPTIN